MTPDGRPFYGGAYFPPAPGFQQRPSLDGCVAFHVGCLAEPREELEEQAGKLIDHIHSANHFYAGLEKNIAVRKANSLLQLNAGPCAEAIMATADQQEGGLGAPSF